VKKDFDYYIGEAKKAEERSKEMWLCANSYIRGVLERCKQEGKTLQQAADIMDKSAGKKKDNTITSLGNLRTAARQIRAGEKLVLL
jgi:hypothetical protein